MSVVAFVRSMRSRGRTDHVWRQVLFVLAERADEILSGSRDCQSDRVLSIDGEAELTDSGLRRALSEYMALSKSTTQASWTEWRMISGTNDESNIRGITFSAGAIVCPNNKAFHPQPVVHG